MSKPNGGFPPIVYCPEKAETKEEKSDDKKRYFSSNIRQNINIRQILTEQNKKPIIVLENNEDQLDVVNSL